MKNSKRMMIKAKTSNAIHAIVNPNPEKPKWGRMYELNKKISSMSDADKLKMFDELMNVYMDGTRELFFYNLKMRNKKRIQKLRDAKIASGERQAKKKTTKAEYEAMQTAKS